MNAADHLREAIEFGCTRDDHDHIADHRAEVLREAQDATVAWLAKKAGERRAQGPQYARQADLIGVLADKANRGAIRVFLEAAPAPAICPSNTPGPDLGPDCAHWCALPEGHLTPVHQDPNGWLWTEEDAANRVPARRLPADDAETVEEYGVRRADQGPDFVIPSDRTTAEVEMDVAAKWGRTTELVVRRAWYGDWRPACQRHAFEKEHQGVSDAKRRLAGCRYCRHPRVAACHAEGGAPDAA